jgi:nitrogenase delta subunit
MKNYTVELYQYIQEHYLWQFHSRSWDREANINGILGLTAQLLTDEVISLQTPAEKCYYADAVTFVKDIKKDFPGFLELDAEGIKAVIKSLKEKLMEVVVEKSLNCEVNVANY